MTAQTDSMDSLWYAYKNGLVDEATYDLLWNKCELRIPMSHFQEETSAPRLSFSKDPSPDCLLASRKFLLSSSKALSQSWKLLFVDDYSLFGPVTDVVDDDMAAYMNRSDVREALHVTDTPIQSWPSPGGFHYEKEYDACNWSGKVSGPSMIEFYRKIAPELDVVWVYNGDTDPCVSYEGTRTAIKRVGFPEVDGGSYRPWFYEHKRVPLKVLSEKAVMFGPDLLSQDTGVQFGGEIVNYEHNLAFVTIHGSGHVRQFFEVAHTCRWFPNSVRRPPCI